MSALLRLPHSLLRRYLSFLERVLVAAGLSGLLYGLLSSLPVYPRDWDLVIIAAVFVATLWWPGLAYFMAVAVAAYPLYTLSLYVAVLFLAVALLGQRIFIHNLGGLVLVLASPWLASYDLAWAVPLLGGLWWGAAGGAWIGGLAALWGQLAAGMAGLDPDWLTLGGSVPSLAGVAQRFGPADSLQTLKLILEPWAPNASRLLYHLLQIAGWAAVGGVAGILADQAWMQRRRPWASVLIALVGAGALLAMHVGLGLWLEQHTLASVAALWPTLAVSAVIVAAVVSGLELVRHFLEHPLPPPRRRVSAWRRRSASAEPERAPLPLPAQLPEWQAADQPEDLIMLELD